MTFLGGTNGDTGSPDWHLLRAIEAWYLIASEQDRAIESNAPEDVVEALGVRASEAYQSFAHIRPITVEGLVALTRAVVFDERRCRNLPNFFSDSSGLAVANILLGVLSIVGLSARLPVNPELDILDRFVADG